MNKLLAILLLCFTATSCDQLGLKAKDPKGSSNIAFDHAGITENCIECHEKNRPVPVNRVAHGLGADCSTCHTYTNDDIGWLSLKPFEHAEEKESCNKCHESKRPAPPHEASVDCIKCHGYPQWAITSTYDHKPRPAECSVCHEAKRPAAPHDADGDCTGCHEFPDWKNATSFNHDPAPAECVTCHETDRPVAPHDADGECAGCHKFPSWTEGVSFNHSPAPTACNECHETDRPAVPHPETTDCVDCHTFPDFRIAKYSHDPKPAECGEYCHTRPTDVYNRGYPNQGPPPNFDANDKTFPGSGHLVGKDCVECHNTPPEGTTSWGFNHSSPVIPFCLPCHFNKGEDKHGLNNMGQFNFQSFGNCYTCHENYNRNVRRNWDD